MTATAHAGQQNRTPRARTGRAPRRPPDTERICREAVAAARTRRSRRPTASAGARQQSSSATGRRRATAGVCLTAGGAILCLRVRARLDGLDIQTAGLVLMLAGLAWLLAHVPGKRRRLSHGLDRALDYLSFDPCTSASVRCPLDDLLEPAVTGRRG